MINYFPVKLILIQSDLFASDHYKIPKYNLILFNYKLNSHYPMNLTLLPQTPCQSIMQFLDWNDLLALKRVSKQVAALFSYTLNFWSRECFRTYFSFELEHLEDLYQNPKYKGFVKNIPEHLSEPIWKKHFETGKRLKDTFQELLCRGCSSGDARNFINYLFQQLRGKHSFI